MEYFVPLLEVLLLLSAATLVGTIFFIRYYLHTQKKLRQLLAALTLADLLTRRSRRTPIPPEHNGTAKAATEPRKH